MPAFSLLPRFLRSDRSRRSHSPKPSPAGLRGDTPSSHFPSFSTHGDTDQDVHATTGTARLPSPDNNMALCDCSGQPSPVSRSITPMNYVDSNSTMKPSPQNLVVQLPQPPLFRLTSRSLATPLQQSTGLDQQREQGVLKDAHDFTVTGSNFIDNKGNFKLTNINTNFNVSSTFMKDLLKEIIPGAASDSSARYPPPRCHPGTRLNVLKRCLYFIAHCTGQRKMRWVVGSAGVGKSAVMQSVADSPQLQVALKASVFLSINGRDDGTKAIITLSYQFAAKSETYRAAIEDEIARDPSLLHSSMPVQFEKFIVQPFIHNPDLNSAGRVLIIIDGLDECKKTDTQVDLLHLISSFCTSYPASPVVWLIASRPESHITSFFSTAEVIPTYEKEEIAVDSHQGRTDVERFLRDKLTEIGRASDLLHPRWPEDQDLWKVAKAAGGLFAYAQTVIRYISDSNVGDPVSQLSDVLNVIDEHLMADLPLEEHPMALLDALYARILSNIPPKTMKNTRKLLLALASNWDSTLAASRNDKNFIVLCNWLGMTANEAYAAVNRLRSVLYFPKRHEAHKETLIPFHKSFIDYLFRSAFFPDIKLEAQQIKTECAFRVLNEAPNGIDVLGSYAEFLYGELDNTDGAGSYISVTWSAGQEHAWNDNRTRLGMYKLALGEVVAGVERQDPVFQNEFCIKVLQTRLVAYGSRFPFYQLLNLALDKSRHKEFMKHGILTQILANATLIFKISISRQVRLQFNCPVTTMPLRDPWDSACEHERDGDWGQGKVQNWATTFEPHKCHFCLERYQRQAKNWIAHSPDDVVTVMFTAADYCCVELRLVDLDDGVSEWTYWAWIYLDLEERKRLGSNV